jgi:radical SAM protein
MDRTINAAAADFTRAPFLIAWEVTRACALKCLHCRADAIPHRDPSELSTAEAFKFIEDVRTFGDPPPLLIVTGGDPMRRPDLTELVRHAVDVGLTVALTPSGTAAATFSRLEALQKAGLSRVAVSLDGPDAATHDAFRQVRGSYDWTMRIIDSARTLGLPLQINSTVSRMTLPTLHAMARRVREFPIVLWAVFFLVQTGRGGGLDQITAEECEDVLAFLADLSRDVPFGIKTTEAPHYRRVLQQRVAGRPPLPRAGVFTGRGPHLRAPRGVTDGNGFLFVDHRGQITPSGFLPIDCGNVRDDSVVGVYREHELFVSLREPDALEGKCGRCEFRTTCGGSRSRAYAATGSALASDPLCAYEPAGGPLSAPRLVVADALTGSAGSISPGSISPRCANRM